MDISRGGSSGSSARPSLAKSSNAVLIQYTHLLTRNRIFHERHMRQLPKLCQWIQVRQFRNEILAENQCSQIRQTLP